MANQLNVYPELSPPIQQVAGNMLLVNEKSFISGKHAAYNNVCTSVTELFNAQWATYCLFQKQHVSQSCLVLGSLKGH